MGSEEYNDWDRHGNYRHIKDLTTQEEKEEKEKKKRQKANDADHFEPKFKILGTEIIKYTDIVGQEKVIDESKKFNALLKQKELCKCFGTNLPHLLLHGTVGTGKTLLVQVMAHENKADEALLYVSVNLQDFSSKYINTTANQLTATLDHLIETIKSTANPHRHCVIFIDEFDSVGRQRGIESHREDDKVVNALNTYMDGDRKCEDLTFIVATNYYRLIDEAQRSRFGIHLKFEPFKTEKDKEDLFKVHLERASRKMVPEYKKVVLAKIECDVLAKKLEGPITGRHIRDIVNRVINNKVYEVAQSNEFIVSPEILVEDFFPVIEMYSKERKGKKLMGF